MATLNILLARCIWEDILGRYDIFSGIKSPVFYAEFVLRKLEGLLDQIDVLVLHTW